MSSLKNIEDTLKRHKDFLKKKYMVKNIGIFGSFVRGEENSDSDLDILIEFEAEANIGLLGFIEIENKLSELLGVKVDLVEKTALKPRIRGHILNEVIYA